MVELHSFDDHLAVITNFDEILIMNTKSGEMVRPSRYLSPLILFQWNLILLFFARRSSIDLS